MRPNPAILILALSIILLGSFPWLGWAQKEDPQVEHILAELDKAAADFQTLQANPVAPGHGSESFPLRPPVSWPRRVFNGR